MFKDRCLEGRTALVTGGGTGLGLSMAVRFAELGASIVVASRSKEHLDAAVGAIHAKGGKALGLTCDVRSFEEVDAVIDEATRAFGSVDVLVNNAAGNFLCPTEDLTPNGFAAVVGIVLNGTFHATLSAGRRMIESGRGGSILNIIASYAWTGSGFVVPSAAAKAGVLAMTRSLAVEWGHAGIRLNAIAPGPIPTEGAWARLMAFPEAEKKTLERIPLARFGTPEELANLATFLLSDLCSYQTGDCITMDGGEWLAGAGEFSDYRKIPRDVFKAALEKMRPKRRPKPTG